MRQLAIAAALLGLAGCAALRSDAGRYARWREEPERRDRTGRRVVEEPVVRVRLGAGSDGRVELRAESGLDLSSAGAKTAAPANEAVLVRLESGRLAVDVGGRAWLRGIDTLEVQGRGGQIRIGARRYRGDIRVFPGSAGDLVVVNRLGIEAYLYGVVPCEIGPLSDATYEAVKAQAIAARTFTLSRLNRRVGLGHDLFDTHLRDQEYGGAGAEKDIARRAVDATRGEVLTYDGELIEALYHGNCGGVTGNGSQPYLRSVVDSPGRKQPAWCIDGKNFEWQAAVPADSLERALQRLASLARRPTVRSLDLEKDEQSGRVSRVRFRSADGPASVGGSALRMALGLPSHAFDATRRGDTWLFNGRGWGHGSGMCQAGAIAMARAGNSAYEILRHYYSGVRLERRY